MLRINRNVSFASALASERLGVGFEVTLVVGLLVTLMREESVHGGIRHVKRSWVESKTEAQRRENLKRDYRLRTQVVHVHELFGKI